jgi:hypothetical protein
LRLIPKKQMTKRVLMISAPIKLLWVCGCGLVYLFNVIQLFGLSSGVIQSVWVIWVLFQVGCGVSLLDIKYQGLFATLCQLINVSYV